MHAVTGVVIAGAGLYLLLLGVAALLTPPRVESFFGRFASSASSHYVEMLIRIAVGASLVHRSPTLPFGEAFVVFGWILLISSGILLCLPWRWHRRFARLVVPHVIRALPLVGLSSIALGLFLLSALYKASTV